jgi:hypothetical protein
MTRSDPPAVPGNFSDADWRRIRRHLGSMPYSGSVHPAVSRVGDVDGLVAWLESLREQLRAADERNEDRAKDLKHATSIIDAGRTLFAALMPAPASVEVLATFGPPPAADPAVDLPAITDRGDLDDAIAAAIVDAGDGGATVEDIRLWIKDNRFGHGYNAQSITARLAVLTGTGLIADRRTPAERRFFLGRTIDDTSRFGGELVRAVINAIGAAGASGFTVQGIRDWIAGQRAAGEYTDLPGNPGLMAVAGTLTTLETQQLVWHQDSPDDTGEARYHLPIAYCPECEGKGRNCRAHAATNQTGSDAR